SALFPITASPSSISCIAISYSDISGSQGRVRVSLLEPHVRRRDSRAEMRKPFDGHHLGPSQGSFLKKVGVTRRLLNFLSSASAAGDDGGGGNSKTASRPEFGTCDGTSLKIWFRKTTVLLPGHLV